MSHKSQPATPTLATWRQFVGLKNAQEKSVLKRADQKPIADAVLPSLAQSLMDQ